MKGNISDYKRIINYCNIIENEEKDIKMVKKYFKEKGYNKDWIKQQIGDYNFDLNCKKIECLLLVKKKFGETNYNYLV